jgi:hypothetical protein
MVRLVVEPSVLGQLHNLNCEIEFCDAAGQTLGYFVPNASRLDADYEEAMADVSDEELEQARAEDGGRPLSEIMSDLRKL